MRLVLLECDRPLLRLVLDGAGWARTAPSTGPRSCMSAGGPNGKVERYKYYQSNYQSMPKGVRTLNLRFTEDIFLKLKEKKEKSDATSWEDFVIFSILGEGQ